MKGMSLIVKSVTRLVTAFIVIFGIYLVLYGHLSPGGGFPGGVVMTCALILVTLAFGKAYVSKFFAQLAAGIADGTAALSFLAVGLLGYFGGVFFTNFLHSTDTEPYGLFSSGSILISNIAIGLKIAACLFLAFMAVSAYRLGATENKGPKS